MKWAFFGAALIAATQALADPTDAELDALLKTEEVKLWNDCIWHQLARPEKYSDIGVAAQMAFAMCMDDETLIYKAIPSKDEAFLRHTIQIVKVKFKHYLINMLNDANKSSSGQR